jgi:Fic family protein
MTKKTGHYEELTWALDFDSGSARRRKGRRYRAFVPATIGEDDPVFAGPTVALSERAGNSVRELNNDLAGLVSLEGMGRQLLRSEALASSQIEGLSISTRKLAEAELDGHHHFKAQEIMGTIRAMERATAIGAGSRALDLKTITEIHRELATAPPLDRIAGQIREEASWIGGNAPPDAEYVGPPHELVRPLLRDLCRFMNRDDIAPVPQAAIAHAQFESIHPFGDGNGRVGRCLIHVLFRQRGVAPSYVPPLSLVLGANKDAYIAGLTGFRAGKIDAWVAQFARAVETAAKRAREFSSGVAKLQNQWREQLGPVRRDAAVIPLINALPKYPVITATVAMKEIDRSRPATINALSELEKVGVLKRRRNQKKGDSWEAGGLFQLLKRFEKDARMQPTPEAATS